MQWTRVQVLFDVGQQWPKRKVQRDGIMTPDAYLEMKRLVQEPEAVSVSGEHLGAVRVELRKVGDALSSPRQIRRQNT
jgi:hypothetical protein